MNRLKHICGINVSRHIPSNAVLPSRYGHYTDVCFENQQFKSQVSGSDQLSLAKKNHNVGIKYSKQFRQDDLRLVSKGNKTICKQRSRTKSSVTSLKKKLSMDKKLPLGNVVRTVCHYSTCQNVKFNSSGFNKRHKAQIIAIINGAKNINHRDSFVTSVGKYPRSYAEMIADYSEALHKASAVGGRNDSLYFDNTIRKSPFGTFSTPSSVKKIVNVTQHNGIPIEEQENYSSLPDDTIEPFDRCIHEINTVKCHGFQHHDTRIAKAINKANSQDCRITNDLKDDDHSYAKFVANCSKSMHDISLANVSNGGLIPKNVLARNSLQSFVTLRKANSTNTQEGLRKTPPSVATIPLEKNVKEQLVVPKERNWLKEIESVTSDLKSVIEKRAARAVDISKLEESDTPQFVDASDNSPHKVRRLAKLIKAHKQKERDATVKGVNYQSDKVEKHSKDFALQKHSYSQLHSKTSNSQYFSSTSSPARKTSTHVSTRSVLKQPHVKLRMVPSEKESVVSINVDSVSTGLSDPASKQLSVVVQSDQREDPQSTENQWVVSTLRRGAKSALQRNDFGPMRISISEDSAPVKQIEFSINGKPVSELKSITARTERLDVVSSMDKIEIRIPFVKDEAPSKIGETDLSKATDSSTGQILNVQISANFQNESVKGSVEKSTRETTRHQDKDKIPASSSPISKNYYSFNDSVRARENTFDNHKLSNTQQHGFSNNTIEKSINEHKAVSDIEFNIQTAKSLSTDKTTNISFNEGRNNIEMKNLNTKKTMNTVRSSTNKYDKNESSDHRVPSKMIPWWSSSDSFNKIKKKKEDSKPPSSNRNEKKTISNLSHNLFTESLPSKETILTKKIQSINDATATVNNLSNSTLYSKSVEQYLKSKPTVHCSYSFKPNNLNTIPNITRNNLKSKDNQRSTIQEDKKTVGIIQTKPIALTTSDATNTGEHNASKREKASLLREKTLNSAQNLSSNRNLEKEDNYFLKQTKSIDDVFSTKSKMENTLDALKLMEKRKDSSIDYGLKTSRKPTMKLNSRVREIQSPPAGTIRTKDLISNTSATEIKEQIVKTIPVKQIKLDKTKKSEQKVNILKLKDNLTIKNVATSDLNQQKKNDIKNIQQIHQNEVTSNSKNHFLKSTLKKQDKLAEDTIVFQNNPNQNNKNSLLEYNKDKPSSSSNIRISSGTIKESEKLGMSVKVPLEEFKQNRQNSLSNIKNTLKTIQAIEKLRSPTPPKFKEPLDKKMNQKKSSLEIINEIQTKHSTNTNKIADINNQSQTESNSKLITSKIENRVICKNPMDKNAMPDKFVKRINEKDNAEDKTPRILTQNPKSKDSLLKNCEKNPYKSKSSKDKRNPSKSADSLSRKSPGFKSADSKTKPTVMSSDNCTYERKSMLTEPLYPNFNRRDDAISNSQSTMFKSPRNLHNNVLKYRAPRIIGSARPWIVDRPEKNMLYSVWLQQPRDDINKNKKLF